MPYVPPHLRVTKYEDEKPAPKIATTLAEAEAMSRAVKNEAPKSVLASMLSAPKPKKAIAAAKRQQDKRPIHQPQVAASVKPPVAAGSFGSLLPTPEPKAAKAKTPSLPKKVAPVTTPANPAALNVTLKADPRYEAALDDILRTIFEENMAKVKRIATANVGDFTRRVSGSYKNERLESRFQGFKLQKLEEVTGDVSNALEQVLRSRFELAMGSVKRLSTANATDFTRGPKGSYRNERLESRFQGYLMGSLNDFGLGVLKKIADNRVAALAAAK